jgi:hypothetical protein
MTVTGKCYLQHIIKGKLKIGKHKNRLNFFLIVEEEMFASICKKCFENYENERQKKNIFK